MNQQELTSYKQPWLGSRWVEILFIQLPPFGCLFFIFLFPEYFQNTSEMNTIQWLVLVLMIDVSHVYSTIFRTYLSKDAWSRFGTPMKWVPIGSLMVGICLYAIQPMLFWSVLAYLAVFHFVRQQYGIMKLYMRQDRQPKWMERMDIFMIYYATIYPLIYWHCSGNRNFNWFIKGDFINLPFGWLLNIASILFILGIGVYTIKELILFRKYKYINFLKNGIMLGTLVSWYFGIVYFNGDLSFTLMNVVSHGLPYLALIWIFGQRKEGKQAGLLKVIFKQYGIVLFLGILLLLAYFEEGLWDSLVWNEHQSLFTLFNGLYQFNTQQLLIILVPLLSLPQITHYLIDGYIWKKSN